MTDLDSHIGELRSKLISIIIGIIVIFFLLTPWMEGCFDLLTKNLKLTEQFHLIAINPLAPTLTLLKSAFFISMMINFPHVIFQIWQFINPALYAQERKMTSTLLISSSLLFYLGAAFAYFVSVPLIVDFNQWILPESVKFTLNIESYLNFLILCVLTFSLFFLLPVIMLLLVKEGFTSINKLIRLRKYFILFSFLVAMFITPPDIFSQTMLALPLYILYELGIVLSKVANKYDNVK